jgi:ankyrin
MLHYAASRGDCELLRQELSPRNVNELGPNRRVPLSYAAEHGHVDATNLLISANATIDAPDGLFQTPLSFAICNDHLPIVHVLIAAKANINLCEADMLSPLCLASEKRGRHHIALALIAAKAHVNHPTHTRHPLAIAASKGAIETVRLLLCVRADPNAEFMGSGYTALMFASQNGFHDVVNTLIQAKADIHKMTDTGRTALSLAASSGRADIINTLLTSDPSALSTSLTTHQANQPSHSNTRDITPENPLCLAVRCGHEDVASALLQHNAYVDTVDRSGWTSLMSAARLRYISMIKLLLNAGADANMGGGDSGLTPLGLAAEYSTSEAVKLLLDGKADVNACFDGENSALSRAIQVGNLDIVNTLLAAGADVKMVYWSKQTSLMMAMESRYRYTHYSREHLSTSCLAIIRVLVSAGADVDAKNSDGESPTLLAAGAGDNTVVEDLLRAGADVNAATLFGMTPLLAAAKRGHDNVVSTLLRYKCDIWSCTRQKTTALMLAAEGGHSRVIDVLVKGIVSE